MSATGPGRMCLRCGGTVAAHLAFCTHCGSPLAAAPPTPPQVYDPPPPPPRRRRTGLVALWVVLAVLLVVGGVTAGFLLDEDPEPRRTVSDVSDREPSADPSTPDPSVPDPTTAAPVEPSVEPSGEPSPVQCWDGTRAARLADCGWPRGPQGIRWVFPSMDDADCAPGEARRVQIWNCYDSLADGTVIRFNYSEWDNFAAAAGYYGNPAYDGEFSETRMPDGRYRWLSYDLNKAQYKAAFAYDRAPWSVTIYADTEADRGAAIDELLVMRPREDLRGAR